MVIVLSCEDYEGFFGDQLGLTRRAYIDSYRNDWSWEYASQMQSAGVKTVIVVPTWGPWQRSVTSDGITVEWLSLTGYVRIYRHVPALKRTPLGRWIAEIFMARALANQLNQVLGRTCKPVLYVQEYWTGRFDYLALRFGARFPVIGADHGGMARRQIKLAKQVAFRRAASLTAQSQTEADTARRYGARVKLLPNAVDTEFFSPTDLKATSKVILHVARLVDTHKKTSLIIRALVQLPEYKLIIVGDGPDASMLKLLAIELGVSDRVDFRGFVTDRLELRKLYRDACTLVQPSTHEARLLVALESMACGTPCVLSRIEAFTELLSAERVGVLVDWTAESVASGVIAVTSAGLQMRLAARSSVLTSSSWATRRRELRTLLDQAIAE